METTNKQSVLIDLKKPNVISTPQFIQQDTNIINFIIKENGVDADFSNIGNVIVNYKRPDGKVITKMLFPDGNSLSYKVGSAEMEVAGVGELEIQFYNLDATERISTRRFKVEFSQVIGSDEVIRDDEEYSLLQALFTEVNNFYENTQILENERQVNEQARVEAENQRQANETTRQQKMNELTDLYDDITTAVNDVNNLITTGQDILDDVQDKANNAQTQADYAKAQGDYAKQQGDYAKSQAELIDTILDGSKTVLSVNGQTGAVHLEANDVGAIPASEKGVAGGVAKLNAQGQVVNANGESVEEELQSIKEKVNEFILHKNEKATISRSGHVNHAVLEVTLDTSWSGSSAPFTKSVTVNGIQSSDTPIIDVIMSGTFSTDQKRQEDWGYIYRAVTNTDLITFYASEKPTISLPVQIKVVR